MKSELQPSHDIEKLPTTPVELEVTPQELAKWLAECPAGILIDAYKDNGSYQRFRFAKEYMIDGKKCFSRLRISLDVSPVKPYQNQDESENPEV